jgi:molecular chaperone DnaK (HSP70)
MARKKKNTKLPTAVKAEYVAKVEEAILAGFPRSAIQQLAANEKWAHPDTPETPLHPRAIDRYIREAKDNLAASYEKRREVHMGIADRRLEFLYTRAVRSNDYRTALAVEKQRQRIHEIGTTIKHEHGGDPEGTPIQHAISDAKASLEERLTQIAARRHEVEEIQAGETATE